MYSLTIYLAGAIRDNVAEDIEWRESVIAALKHLPIRFINPVGGKTYHPETRVWTVGGIPSGARLITKHDKWSVEQSDIVLFNFRALSQKYPNIGTLVEFGMAVMRDPKCLIYSIIDPDYSGAGNSGMFKLHPFLEEFSSVVFPDVPSAIAFMKSHLAVLSGKKPSYVNED